MSPFFITTQSLDRHEAVRRINLLARKDLRPMADEFKIPVWKNGHENKGWAGLVIEHYLGLPQNSRQAPDFERALTRVLTLPYWGGVWQSNGQPAVLNDQLQIGALFSLWNAQQQQADRLALLGVLALEQGDLERARQGFTQALQTAGPNLNFRLRGVAQGWLELFPEKPAP